MGILLRHEACEKCGSSDGKAVYTDGSWHCWIPGCTNRKVSDEFKEENDDKPKSKVRSTAFVNSDQSTNTKVKMKESISAEKAQDIKERTSFDETGFRGITLATNKFFGARYSYDGDNVEEVFYPVTRDGDLSGYKIRQVPKSFSSTGAVGNDCDLFGAFRFKAGGKYLLIVEGEHDAMAAYQMFKDYSDSKESDFVVSVVSITTGAGGCSKQLAVNYDFINSFENVILGLDNDAAGKEALEKAVSALPKGKVKLATWTKAKDPNQYLEDDKAKFFIQDFYNAKPYVPAGVVSSSDLYEKILSQAVIEKVTFPPFLKKLEAMLGGGLILGHIYNIAAMTSIGKTAIVNELVYWWIFESPHLVGVVSMELNAGQYGETILSRHLQSKLARLSVEDKMLQLNSDIVRRKGLEVFQKPSGEPRFYLVDDRDGTVEQIQEVIEQMVIGSGVKIVIIDPLQDLIEGMSNEEQGLFMKWCKSMVKSHNISFVLINHMRKTAQGNSSMDVTESDIMGSSTIMKSASANILLKRNKEAEDSIERNTTYVSLPKSRVTGETGPAGKIYYDNQTHMMHDFDEYWATHARPEPGSEF